MQLAKHTHTNKHTRCTLRWREGGMEGVLRKGTSEERTERGRNEESGRGREEAIFQ